MLIEFLGVPGSGKSTLSHGLFERLEARGLAVDEPTYRLDRRPRRAARVMAKLRCVSAFALAQPALAWSAMARVRASRQATWLDFGKCAFNWTLISALASRPGPRRLILLDQGFAQGLWSIAYAAQRDADIPCWITALADAGMLPDLIVHVHAGQDIVAERLALRAQFESRIDRIGHDREVMRRADALCCSIARAFEARHVPILRVSGATSEDFTRSLHVVEGCALALISGKWAPHPQTQPSAGAPSAPTKLRTPARRLSQALPWNAEGER
jgi:thymidylate kinase